VLQCRVAWARDERASQRVRGLTKSAQKGKAPVNVGAELIGHRGLNDADVDQYGADRIAGNLSRTE
jgi:hypothetical protein